MSTDAPRAHHGTASRARLTDAGYDAGDVRLWASGSDSPVGDRGLLPVTLIDLFLLAHDIT
jgi:hypothetical protein